MKPMDQLLPPRLELKEAADALKALALRSMKYSKVEFMEPAERVPGLLYEMAYYQRPVIRLSPCGHQGETGLLDSGASVCLRPPKPGELECSTKRSVQLAVGHKEMWTSSLGTILDETAKEPIVSLPQLIAIGYRVRWGSQGMILTDRKNHRVPVQSQGGCPEVSKDCALRLIAEIEEQLAKGKQAQSRVAKLLESNPNQTPRELLNNLREKLSEGKEAYEELRLWLAKVFPDVPADLLDKVSASPSLVGEEAPWNRRQRRTMLLAKGGILVNLFAGSTRGRFRGVANKHKLHLLDMDVGEDLLQNSTFGYVIALALIGRIKVVLGGPPCRTYSPCRLLPGGPPVVRTRSGDFRWGRPDAPPKELAKLAADNVLALRMAALMLIAHESNLDLGLGDTACLGEHPRDPAEYRVDSESLEKLPVLFKTPEWEYVREMLGLQLIAFNQGPLGHVRVKPTHLCTNLRLDWLTHATAGVEGLDMSKDTSQSKEWACWAPGLVKAIAEALDEFLLEKPPKVCALESSEERMRRHIIAGHLPYWKRCRACLEGRARDRAHHRQGVVETSVLSVDLAGPFQKGNDESSPGAKYALV